MFNPAVYLGKYTKYIYLCTLCNVFDMQSVFTMFQASSTVAVAFTGWRNWWNRVKHCPLHRATSQLPHHVPTRLPLYEFSLLLASPHTQHFLLLPCGIVWRKWRSCRRARFPMLRIGLKWIHHLSVSGPSSWSSSDYVWPAKGLLNDVPSELCS